MNRKWFIYSLLLFTTIKVFSQEVDPKSADHPFLFELSYVGDNASNLSGGIKKGYNYMGYVAVHLTLDTEKAGMWKGGRLFVNAANTHGGMASANLYGDMQVVSNIEAGNHTYLQELWYSQVLNKVELIAGLQDMNVELINTMYGSEFLNSSFGMVPTLSLNFNAPIFPLTTIGITEKWNISDKTTWINALYDGNPTPFEDNPYNLKWQLKRGDGILAVSELQQRLSLHHLPGTVKLGAFSRNHFLEETLGKTIPDSLNHSQWGMYAIVDQEVWHFEKQSLGAFLQVSYSPSTSVTADFYSGVGIHATGLFTRERNDVFGLAVAYTHLPKISSSETILELTWNKPLGEYFFIQPDIQYIIHPSGKKSNLPNALAAILRFGFNF